MESKYSFLEAKQKLETLCAYQEKCQFDIYSKLKEWNFCEEQTQQLISHLITYNFINEERFAEAFVNDKYKIKKWGKNKIKMHLKQKRISDYSIKNSLLKIDLDIYLKNLKEIGEKKWFDLNKKNQTEWIKKGKLTNYLLSRGFENDLVYEVINEISK